MVKVFVGLLCTVLTVYGSQNLHHLRPHKDNSAKVTALFAAILHDDAASVQKLLKVVSPNATNSKGEPALHYAVSFARLIIVRELVQAGASINAKDRAGESPLTLATKHDGEEEVVYYLIEKGADPNYVKPGEGNTLMFYAITDWPSTRLVSELLNKGVNANGDDYIQEWVTESTVPIPAGLTDLQRLEFSEKHAGKRTYQRTKGDSYLFIASRVGNVDAAKLLIGHGANPNRQTASGSYPIFAASDNSLAMVQLLVEHGANPNVRNADGQTVLSYLIHGGKPQREIGPTEAQEVADYLKSHGAHE